MNETLLWLMYILGGAGAFALVRYRGWAITPSTLLPGVVGTALWYLAVELGKEKDEPAWINVDLAMNFSFFLIFAAVGAGLGMLLRQRDASDEADKGA